MHVYGIKISRICHKMNRDDVDLSGIPLKVSYDEQNNVQDDEGNNFVASLISLSCTWEHIKLLLKEFYFVLSFFINKMWRINI